MGDLPRPGLEPVSPALAGRFLTTAPPGKPYFLYGECFLWLKKSLLPQGPEDIFMFYSRNLIVLSFTFRLMTIWNGVCFVCCEAGIKDYFSPLVTEWIQHRLLKRPSSFPFCRQNNGPQRCPHSILILEFVIMQLYTEKGIIWRIFRCSLLWIIQLGPM